MNLNPFLKKRNSIQTAYCLQNIKTGNLLSYYTTVNDPEFESVSTSYTLYEDPYDETWIAKSWWQAAYVAKYPTRWFNASYDTPSHNFKLEELKILDISLTMNSSIVLLSKNIPSYDEWLETSPLLSKTDRAFFRQLHDSSLHDKMSFRYSLSQLEEYLKATKQI